MMFLLRCAFWLGLTFALMDWPDGAPPTPDPQALAQMAAQMAAQEIAGRCAASPQACLDGARKIEEFRKIASEGPKAQDRTTAPRGGN
jgi:hypothetical protein